MKIPKHYIGKEARITWLDPVSNHEKLVNLDEPVKRGRVALAKWIERGVIEDIAEGIVRVSIAQTFSPGASSPDEAIMGWIPEDLIEACEIMEPMKENT